MWKWLAEWLINRMLILHVSYTASLRFLLGERDEAALRERDEAAV